MKRWLAIAGLVALVVLVVGAAFLVTRSAGPAEIRLAEKDRGGTVTTEMGQEVVIVLPSNPTTGFSWQVVDPSPLVQLGEPEYTAPQTTRVGAGGTETFRFRAETPGTGTLRLEYRRPWESGGPAEDTWETAIIIEEAAP